MMSNTFSIPPELVNSSALPAPDGVIPNFDNPPNKNALGIGVVILCLSLATVCAGLRAFSKLVCVKKVEIEDYFAIIAYVFYRLCTILQLHSNSSLGILHWVCVDCPRIGLNCWLVRQSVGSFGARRSAIHVCELFQALMPGILSDVNSQVGHILQIVYSFTMLFAKTAVLLDWNRIFAPRRVRNTFFWLSHAVMLLNFLLYASAIIALGLSCRPQEKYWKFWLPGECTNSRALDISTSSFNLVIDTLILVLPQNSIWRLSISKQRKIGVALIFSVGVLYVATPLQSSYSNPKPVSKLRIQLLTQSFCRRQRSCWGGR
ncbi:hypothetical protein F4801DRAFT_571488 [Xylaria longipes]|nr:hypothetical protein F4801DRAFT_571488 [Xylaria longipes]